MNQLSKDIPLYWKILINTIMKFSNLISDEFDKSCATLGIAFSMILIVYMSIFLNRIIYSLIGFLSLIACVIWLLIRKKSSLNLIQTQSHSLYLLLLSIFFILFTFSVLSFYFRPNLYERPLIYFVFMSFMVGIIGLELFFKNIKKLLLLFQILLVGISIAWSQLLLFPGLVGDDPWVHQMITSIILNLHNIPDGYNYSKLPIFHLLIASTSLVTGLNYKFAAMMSVGFLQVLCIILLIFLLCMFLFDDYKISLLACLSIIVCNNQIYMSCWSIPNALGTIFILYLLYILVILKNKSYQISIILSIFFMVVLILTHTIASIFMAIILFIYSFGFKLYPLLCSLKEAPVSRKVPVSLTYSVLFIVSMFAWWAFSTRYLNTLGKLLKWGFSIDSFSKSPQDLAPKYIMMVPIPEQIFNFLGMFLFFTLCFVGCFYMISKKHGSCSTFIFTIIGLTPLFLGFFSLITKHSVIEHRWFYFAQIFLSIPFAVSIMVISNSFKNNYLKYGLLFFSMTFISFLMIMSPLANVDNHIFSPNSSATSSFTMSELQAVKTTSNIWNGTIKTDRVCSGCLNTMYILEPFCDEIYRKNILDLQHNMVLIRKNIIGKPFKLFSSLFILDYDPRELLSDSYFSKIYNCGSVEGYLKVQQ